MFGDRIRELRIERKMSLAQLGKALNMSRQNINIFELNEHYPTLRTALTFADYFGVSLDYLTGRTDRRYLNENYYASKIEAAREELNLITEKIDTVHIENLGLKIRIKRAERNWSQAQLSEKSGISRCSIYKIEKNQIKPSANTIKKLLEALETL